MQGVSYNRRLSRKKKKGKKLKKWFLSLLLFLINNDLDMHIQAKTNDRRVRRFGDILAPLSRETKLKMRLRE